MAGQLPQCHTAMVSTCAWQSCQTQPVADQKIEFIEDLGVLAESAACSPPELSAVGLPRAISGLQGAAPRAGGTEKSSSFANLGVLAGQR